MLLYVIILDDDDVDVIIDVELNVKSDLKYNGEPTLLVHCLY